METSLGGHSFFREPILVVDDDQYTQNLISEIIRRSGGVCHGAGNGREALARLKTGHYPVVITDIQMPEMNGMELLMQIRLLHPATDVIVITGYSVDYTFTDVILAGGSDFLTKPFSVDEVQARLFRLLREQEATERLRAEIKAQAQTVAGLRYEAVDRNKRCKCDSLAHKGQAIRAPMNDIRGMTDLVLATDLSPQQRRYLNTVRDAFSSLSTHVDDVFDFTRGDA